MKPPRAPASLPLRLAQFLLLVLTVGGATAFALQMASWPDHPLADMTHIAWWVRLVGQEGVSRAYEGVYPETYIIYPPGMTYVYALSAGLAERIPPPSGFSGDWLRFCTKLVPIAGQAALALALFDVVARAAGFWRGWLAATLVAWNPATLFDSAYWSQGDSLPTLCAVLAIGALFVAPAWWPLRRVGRWRWAPQLAAVAAGTATGVLLAAGGLVKPQLWVVLPLLLWVIARRLGPLGFASAAAAAGLAGWWLLQPWIRVGRLPEALSVFTNVAQVMPSVSANGHNLWWLKLPGVAISVLDWQPVGGFGQWETPPLVTFATLGRLGFGLFALLPLLRLTGALNLPLVLAGAAYTSAAYFMAVTQVHENHLYAAIPFLAGAAALDWWLLPPLLVFSLGSFLNMALHDFLIGDALVAQIGLWFPALPWRGPLALQTANAYLLVAGFALFTLLFLRRPPARRQNAPALVWRARLVLAAGSALAGASLGLLLAVLRRSEVAGRLWDRLAAAALASGPVEAKLGHHTPAEQLLAGAAVQYANLLYTLAGVAAICGALAAVAGSWWLLQAKT